MSTRPRRTRLLKVAGWSLVILFLTYRMSPDLSGHFGRGSVGTTIPEFSAATTDGAPMTRASLAGKVVLVNFWASWCGPCLVEMPAFQRFYADHKNSGFVILGIWTQDSDISAMHEQLRTGNITYPIVVGTRDLVETFGGVTGLPISLLVDRTGRIRRRVYGVFHEDEFRAAADSLLREAAAP